MKRGTTRSASAASKESPVPATASGATASVEPCGDLGPISMCPCVKPEGHVWLDLFSNPGSLTDAQVRESQHQCAHGRRWI